MATSVLKRCFYQGSRAHHPISGLSTRVVSGREGHRMRDPKTYLTLILAMGLLAGVPGCHDEGGSVERASLASCGEDVKLVSATGFVPEHAAEVTDVGCVSTRGKREGPAMRLVGGRAVSFSNFSNGRQDGPSVVLDRDGSLQAVTISDEGEPKSAYFWNADGLMKHTAEVDAESATTTHTYWHRNGSMEKRFKTARPGILSPPTEAVLDGPFTAWSEDGSQLATGTYSDGEKVGLWRCRTTSSTREISLDLSTSAQPSSDGTSREALDACVSALFEHDRGSSIAALQPR